MCGKTCWKISFLIACVCIALCSAFYFWYAAVAAEADPFAVGEFITYILSALFLLLLGGCGSAFGCLEKAPCVNVVMIAMLIMFIFSIIQMILVAVALSSCDGGDAQNDLNPWNSLCVLSEDDRWQFWLPTIVILTVELVGLVTSCGFKKELSEDDSGAGKSNYY